MINHGRLRRSIAVRGSVAFVAAAAASAAVLALGPRAAAEPGGGRSLVLVGREVAIPAHLRDGAELGMSGRQLVEMGRALFSARWTSAEGQGRPASKGTGAALTDPASRLVFPRNFNRLSGPDTGGCSGCHNQPQVGGGGDIVGNVFVLADRFDFVTFGDRDRVPLRGAADELGRSLTLQSAANSRRTVGMFGAGYVEMLSRQITADLRAAAAACPMGSACPLQSKGISYGVLGHLPDGTWDTSRVEGLAPQSTATSGTDGPSLLVRPFSQAGATVSLRQFTNGAFNQHHGIQSAERFGAGLDADGDGFADELTRADVTAVVLFQATLPVPGRVIPRNRAVEAAIARGERLFTAQGCAACHVPRLPLTDRGWVFSEPNPFNPPGNLQPGGGVPPVSVDLSRGDLPQPRLPVVGGEVMVPAYTDLKLHQMTDGLPSCGSRPDLIASRQCDGNVEPLDQNHAPGTPAFFAGNGRFITRKLWGIANQHSFGHHGQFTTMREAVLAHAGEARAARAGFAALPAADQDAVIEFLKSLRVLPPNTRCLVVDEDNRCR